MSESNYKEVKRLLYENKLDEAEVLQNKIKESMNGTIEENFWYLIISSDVKRYKKEYQEARDLLEEALESSSSIELTKHQYSRVQGKLGEIHYRMKEYDEVIPLLRQALVNCPDEVRRRNYYYSRLLSAFNYLGRLEDFSKLLSDSMRENLKKITIESWDFAIDFVWRIIGFSKEPPWDEKFQEVLENLKIGNTDYLSLSVIEFAKAGLARQKKDYKRFISHMNQSLKFTKTINSKIYVSMTLNLVSMLQTPFGDYFLSKKLLFRCLELTPDLTGRRVHILNRLGSNLRFSGEYFRAINYLEEALEINRINVKDSWQEAYTHNTLGMIFTLLGEGNKALKHYQASLNLSKEMNDVVGLGYTYGAIAWLKSNQGDLLEAKTWYNQSIKAFKKRIQPPAIILLAYAELLSRIDETYTETVDELISKVKTQIWKNQKHIDMGRYYNTLGKIALNRKRLQEAEKVFSLALEYGESFEVEAQTLLGLTKLNLEYFLTTDNEEYLRKAELFLGDLRLASKSSALILGEVDLILGIIEMYKLHFKNSKQKLNQVHEHAKQYNFSSLEERILKQLNTLKILESHEKLQEVVSSSGTQQQKPRSIREILEYLNELSKIINTHPTSKHSKD